MLGIGGFHVGWTTEKDAEEVIEAAIAGGIRFFDTAESYNRARANAATEDSPYEVPGRHLPP